MTVQNFAERLGQTIRTRRMAAAVATDGLADTIGVTAQQLHKYEVGANCIDAIRLAQISVALGVRIEDLFDGIPTGGKAVEPAAANEDRPIDGLAAS